ncbi:hypothetical protein IHE44_0004833 [Lamprotornis superbus]|uniref:K Homology domain-containing protein n=1 Tax=Lamprotornis superbus TaxID=245042 RepID=A0A835ND16_9PASS|nr:hypothetical protein IHE44_0004833 [Lamprotornis superbus]
MLKANISANLCVNLYSFCRILEITDLYQINGKKFKPTSCKIKALRAKTNTYIKTPVRGEEPVFVVTGRKEDVTMAKREIISAAEHFSMIRASRNKSSPALGGLPCTPNLPGQMTVQVRVPYRVVGLVVGPKGATIKRIQQQTHTYIVTPSRDKEPVFEVTGMPENVNSAREEIEMHIAMRTGNYIKLNKENDFYYSGTDVSFEGGTLSDPASNTKPQCRGRQPSTPCLSPTFPESLDHPLAGRVSSDPSRTGHQVGLPMYIPAFSNGTNSYSSSNGGSTSSSPPESRQKHDCMMCFENQVVAALVPCGHNLFCLEQCFTLTQQINKINPNCQSAPGYPQLLLPSYIYEEHDQKES